MNTTSTNGLTEESQEAALGFNEVLTSTSIKATMAAAGAPSRDLWQVNLDHILMLPNFNVRVHDTKYEEHIEQIKRSILKDGFFQDKPLAGFAAKENGVQVIYLTDGYTRYEATKRANVEGANIPALPMVIKPPGTSMEDLTVGIWASNEGKPLTPYEKAVVCKRLIGYGWTEEQIAERFNVTTNYVRQLLTVIGAPIEIRRMVQDGVVSLDRAFFVINKMGAKEAVAMLTGAAEQAQAQGKTKIAAKHLPGATYAKVVKKQAPAMADTLKSVQSDPAYASLSPETRTKLDEVLSKLKAAEEPAASEGEAANDPEAT